METPQDQAPTTPRSGDLYSAITAEDEVPVVDSAPKKHISPFMKMVITFMRLTFWMDLTKKSNEPFFRILGAIWITFMSILYLSGIVTLTLCLTSFVHLPLKLEAFFNQNNIKYDTLEIQDYSLSQINISNLHDEKSTYQIPQVRIHSTFGDFLKNKILLIEADGVKINVSSNSSEKTNIQWMLDLFSAFNGSRIKKLDVNSLIINNALLTFSGKKITLPIVFSLTGDYTQNAQTAILFNINEDFFKAQGTLSLTGTTSDQNLKLSITSGAITLPNHPEEELTGEIEAVLNNNEIQSASAHFNLSYGHAVKEITLEIKKSSTSGFDGEMHFYSKNTASESLAQTPLLDISTNFQNLQIDENGQIKTSQPLKLKIQHLEQNDIVIEGLETLLKGQLVCQISEGKCTYTLKEKSDINLATLSWRHQGKEFVLDQNAPLHLLSNNHENLVLQLQSPSFQINLLMDNTKANGYVDKEDNTLKVEAERIFLSNTHSNNSTENIFALKVIEGKIITPDISIQNIDFSSDDLLNETTPLRFQAKYVSLNSPLIKKPFSAQIISLSNQTSLKLQILNSDIYLGAKGVLDFLNLTFSGTFATTDIQIENLPFDLKELSDYIPQKLDYIGGQLTLGGSVHLKNSQDISGHIILGIKNASFNAENTHIKNLNTVVSLQSLYPLFSAPNQFFMIEDIEDNLDVQNISGTFQIINQSLRLFNLKGQLANQEIAAQNIVLPFDNPSALVYFKTGKDFKINDLSPYLNLFDLNLKGGTGNFSLPVELSSKGLHFSDLTFKINDTTLSETQKTKNDPFHLFNKNNSSYYIRSGKFILNKGLFLDTSLEGWLLPQKQKKSVEIQKTSLANPLLKKGPYQSLPVEFYKKLTSLFTQKSNP